MKTIEALVEGGKATAAPPLGPSLAELKLNVGEVIAKVNEATKDYANMNVPVKITVDEDSGEYKIEVGTPPVSSLIRKELGLKKIAPEKKEEEGGVVGVVEEETVKKRGKRKVKEEAPAERVIVGNLTVDQCVKIAKMKRDDILAKNLKLATKEVIASAVSMPITIEERNPKEILKEIDEGNYNDRF